LLANLGGVLQIDRYCQYGGNGVVYSATKIKQIDFIGVFLNKDLSETINIRLLELRKVLLKIVIC
jgi:hypothetical protein